MNIKSLSQGFTLIELMIVVAIIGILASIAVSSYNIYAARAQAAEAIHLASTARTAVAETFQNTGSLPTSNASAGLSNASSYIGRYVESVSIGASGVVIAKLRNSAPVTSVIRNGTIELEPINNNGSITWKCHTTFTRLYAPSTCH